MKREPVKQHVVIEKRLFETTRDDYQPVLYSIEVGDIQLDGIYHETALIVYEKLGAFLFPEKQEGGES